jgi:hypothetical protein
VALPNTDSECKYTGERVWLYNELINGFAATNILKFNEMESGKIHW